MARIYIIGPVASGKTSLARKLSEKLETDFYELDKVVFEIKESGDRKRSKEEISKIFNEIIKSKDWIIEDVGREIFKSAYEKADLIIFISIPSIVIYKRIICRWIKQMMGIEKTTYKPNIEMLKKMFKWANNDIKNSKLEVLKAYSNKLLIVDNKMINNYIKKNIKI